MSASPISLLPSARPTAETTSLAGVVSTPEITSGNKSPPSVEHSPGDVAPHTSGLDPVRHSLSEPVVVPAADVSSSPGQISPTVQAITTSTMGATVTGTLEVPSAANDSPTLDTPSTTSDSTSTGETSSVPLRRLLPSIDNDGTEGVEGPENTMSTGGVTGTGNVADSGGTTGTGGAMGSGGATGAGEATGTGDGTGSGGPGGSGGSGGTGGGVGTGSPAGNDEGPDNNNGALDDNDSGPVVNDGGPDANNGGQAVNDGGPEVNDGGPDANNGGLNVHNGGPAVNEEGLVVNNGGPDVNNAGPAVNQGGLAAPVGGVGDGNDLRNAEEGTAGAGGSQTRPYRPLSEWVLNGENIFTMSFKGAFLFVCGGWHFADLPLPWCPPWLYPFAEKCIHFFYMLIFSFIILMFAFICTGRA